MTEVTPLYAPTARIVARPTRPDRYARAAGVCLLLTMGCGFVGELYIPSRLVVGNDAAATATRILASEGLFRLGFAAYLVEAICDVSLCWLWFVLLGPVHRPLALLSVLFGLVSMTLYAMGEGLYFGALVTLEQPAMLSAFPPAQVQALALLWIKLFSAMTSVFMAFYGIANVIRGYLIVRSGFLPRWLGVLLVIAGTAFILRNGAMVLAPEQVSDLLLLPTFVAVVSLGGWLLVRGVDGPRWHAAADTEQVRQAVTH